MNNSGIGGSIKQNLLNLIILGIAVIIAFKVYQSKESEIKNLMLQKETEESKNSVLTEISNVEKDIDSLAAQVNNKSLSAVLDKISDFAKNSSVNISKISPQKETIIGPYTKYSYELSLSASSYHILGSFISVLENSSDIYRVDNLIINSDSNASGLVSASLTVYTILINK